MRRIEDEHLCSRSLAQELDKSRNSLRSIRLSAKQDYLNFFPKCSSAIDAFAVLMPLLATCKLTAGNCSIFSGSSSVTQTVRRAT
jgi:hypothetical protein